MSMGRSVREAVAEYAKLSQGDIEPHKSPSKRAASKPKVDMARTAGDTTAFADRTMRGLWQDTTTTQIDLLQRAICLLKSHATEAGSNLARLRSLLADGAQLEPEQLQSLQRERWLEERRELDATKALWSTYQHAEAIVADDYLFFSHRREAEDRKRRWYESQEDAERPHVPTLVREEGYESTFYPLSRKRRQAQTQQEFLTAQADPQPQLLVPSTDHAIPPGELLIPLALACKADPEALLPKRAFSFEEEDDMGGSEEDDGSDFVRGTVTIFRLNRTSGNHKSRKPSTSSTFRRMAEQEVGDVSMPDYVADLLSEFDGQTAVPALSLLSPSPSLPERESGHFALSPRLDTEPPRSPSPPTTIASPTSAPTSPMRSRLKRMPSAKRISGFFNKRPSMSSLQQSESPYPLHATQIPSRLGSSIDLVIHEETPFGVTLDFESIGRMSGTFASPTLSQGNWGNSPISPSGLNPNRFSDSAAITNSMVSLMSSQETTTSATTSVTPPPALASAPTASLLSRDSEGTSAASASPVVQPPSSPESRRFAERLKKRMSALRF